MNAELELTCDQPNCTVLSDGRCLEGRDDPSNCPYRRDKQPEDTKAARHELVDPETLEDDSPSIEDLPDGNRLSVKTCHVVTHSTRARVIVVAGRADSGKTTLLASIYEEFQKGPFAGYNFAGSRTLPGFEKRCFLSRVSSERHTPDTERSKGEFGETLLHLRVRLVDNSRPARDLLFTDLAGEDFHQAMDSTDFCKKLSVVKRADHFVLLIDGDKIKDLASRQLALADGVQLLQRFLDCGMLDDTSRVDILVTKYDRWRNEENLPQTKEFLEHLKATLRKQAIKRVKHLRFEYIAARPEDSKGLDQAFELDSIFPNWAELTSACKTCTEGRINCDATREYDRFLFRNCGGLAE